MLTAWTGDDCWIDDLTGKDIGTEGGLYKSGGCIKN